MGWFELLAEMLGIIRFERRDVRLVAVDDDVELGV
jgi:hypothetical protein